MAVSQNTVPPSTESVSLREYVDIRFDASEKAVNIALVAAEKAVIAALKAADIAAEKSEKQGEEWRRSANEWRGAMVDREARFITSPMHTALLEKLEAQNESMVRMQSRLDLMQGKGSGLAAGWGYMISAVGLGTAVISFLILWK